MTLRRWHAGTVPALRLRAPRARVALATLLAVVVVPTFAACGSEPDSVFEPEPTGADGSATPSPSPTSTNPIGFPTEASATCATVQCGASGACCGAGEECVEGACAAPCATGGPRCAATCCPQGNVCLAGACAAPGVACKDSFDCPEDAFCEPTLGRCLPQPPGASSCQVTPTFLPLEPTLEWSWTTPVVQPDYAQVVNTPIVADVDKDGIPDVVIVTSKNGPGADSDFGDSDPAFVRLLDGKTGVEKWGAAVDAYADGTGGRPDYRANPRGTPAVGDLDGDGTLEIVVPRRSGGVLAFRANGSLLWASTRADGTTPYTSAFDSITVALADLDNDGKAEVVLGGVVLDHLGRLVTNASIGREAWGGNDASYGAVSIVADVDGVAATTAQHVVTGNRAIRKDGTFVWDVSATVPDGYPAISDLDEDGTPELVVVGAGQLRVQNALTGAVLAQLALPGSGRGGPPTVADFDRDGRMEIAAANGTAYSVFEYDPAATPRLSVKWSKPTQDGSSNVTGSSVFDFEGDGAAEVLYNDECYARVYKGTDGTELFRVPNSSATIHEYPVLVDVDADNNTELVIVANDRNHLHGGLSCAYPAGVTPRRGVFVYGDKNDRWVRTRRIWNQHAYHLTNVLGDGRIPAVETRSFVATENNDYRVSSQGTGVYNAPDLRVDLEVSSFPCPAALELRARVRNLGTLGVPAGVAVRFYAGQSPTGAPLAEKRTTRALLPGEAELVTAQVPPTTAAFVVVVDGEGATSEVRECLEDNNSASVGGVSCGGVR